MEMIRKKNLCISLGLSLAACFGYPSIALGSEKDSQVQEIEVSRVKTLKEGYWYSRDKTLKINLGIAANKDFLLEIDNTDVTPVTRAGDNGTVYIDLRELSLSNKEYKLIIYTGSPNEGWEPSSEITFGILNSFGLEKFSIEPSAEIGLSTQSNHWHRGGDGLVPPDPETFVDLDYNFGLKAAVERGGWSVTSTQSWVGTDEHEKALRYGLLNESAPLFDLTGYNFTITGPDTQIEIGDNSGIGTNPLLINGISNRGITVKRGIQDWFTASFAAQSGKSITGYNYLLGFDQAFNSNYGAEFELKPFSIKEHLSVAYSWLKSELPDIPDFGLGQVASSEKAEGWGVTVKSSLFESRLKLGFDIAESTYSVPDIEEIDEFGNQAVFLNTTTNKAYQASGSFRFIPEESPYTSEISLEAGRYDPQYRVLSGFFGADQLFWRSSLAGRIDSVSYGFNASTSRDNLDEIPSILITRSDNINLAITMPLDEIFYGIEPPSSSDWLPAFNYNYTYTGQYGISNPVNDPLSLFTADNQIPKQYSNTHNVGFTWDYGNLTSTMSLTNSLQNNEQLGRENLDSHVNSLDFSVAYKPIESITLSPRINYVVSMDQSTSISQSNMQHGLDISYQPWSPFTLSTGYTYGNSYTQTGMFGTTDYTAYAQASYSFGSPLGLRYETPGSAFIRFSYAGMKTYDRQAEFFNNGTNFWVNMGLKIKFL